MEDCWNNNSTTLIEHLIQPLNENLSQRRISDFVNGNGNWDRAVLQEILPDQLVNQIISPPPPRIIDPEDSFSWKPSSDGIFSTGLPYDAVKRPS